MVDTRFYVYEHTRRDTGQVFYVGKGSGKRANCASRHHRSEFWQRVASKAHGFDVRLVVVGIDEELAFLAERERIDQLRRLGLQLTNLTDGGDGTSGWLKSPEWRAKVGAAHRGKVVSPEVRAKISAAVRASGYVHSPDARARISAGNRGHRRNVGRVQPQHERERRAASLRGKRSRLGTVQSAEARDAISKALTGIPQRLLTCPHCQKQGGNAMRRWHFDACPEAPKCN